MGVQYQVVAEVVLEQVCKVADAIVTALMISDMSYKRLADRQYYPGAGLDCHEISLIQLFYADMCKTHSSI